MPPPPSKKEKVGPAFNLPASAYPDFLRAIEGSDLPKPVLIMELFETFKHRCTNEGGVLRKGAVENKLSGVAYKEKKVWHVRAAEWVSYYAYTCMIPSSTSHLTGGGGSEATVTVASYFMATIQGTALCLEIQIPGKDSNSQF